MPKPYLEFKRPDRESAIIIHFECGDGKIKYYTGEKGIPGSLTKATEVQLNRMIKFIEGMAAEFRIAGKTLLKQVLTDKLNETYRQGKAKVYLEGRFLAVIEKMKEGKIMTPQNKKYAPGTIRGIRHTVRLIAKFNPKLTQEAVSLEVYKGFIHFCHKQDFATNYIGGQIKNWKTLGKALGGNPVYDHKEFKIISELTPDIYLDELEIKKIFQVRLSKAMSVARDWFVLDCYTGLRVSDLTSLTKQNLTPKTITIANEKTDEKVVIPVHPFVKSILSKYKGFPPKIADQSLNDNIKVIAKKAGIKGNFLFTITKGGKRVDEYIPKWKMVSNHSARRSFITNLIKHGAPESLIMKLAGIKSHATMDRYNKMSSEEAAEIMSKHKFFR